MRFHIIYGPDNIFQLVSNFDSGVSGEVTKLRLVYFSEVGRQSMSGCGGIRFRMQQ